MIDKIDLTFIINQPGQTLKERFDQLIQDAKFFDCLVGYFYVSGFHLIKNALKNVEKVRILVGLGLSKEFQTFFEEEEKNFGLFSDKQIKEQYYNSLKNEFENSTDSKIIEEGIVDFIDLVKSGKLQMRIYPNRKLHAKLYIITFREGDRDVGRVITGSSNLTYSGLVDNLEFNVELKNRSDYEYAKEKFEELWKEGVDVTDKIESVIKQETWLNDQITPYELYLKFLYEYFVDDLNADKYLTEKFIPEGYVEYDYQKQAVLNAKKIIEAYGGCFLADVVGLGKTYMAARLISELRGRTIVIAPPKLISRSNPGSWKNVFSDFNIPAEFFSIGKLDDAIEEISKRNYDNVVIDEAHRFRNESTIGYAKISQICKGKRVILVTATPFNNYPKDLLNQIGLFQSIRKSTIPGIKNLEAFFTKLENRLKDVNREIEYDKYLKTIKENAKEIRDKCLKYIMVRRTRSEIEKYFPEDMKKNNLKFPEVLPPTPLYYFLDEKLDQIFMDTVTLISQNLTYARYKPLLYFKNQDEIDQFERQSQMNLGGFMKVLLVKRLESSFYAFKQTLDRFIKSYELFIGTYKRGKVYFSPTHLQKIFDLLSSDNFEEIERLISEGKAKEYNSSDFNEDFLPHLEHDYNTLQKIRAMWNEINYDPKIDKLIKKLKNDPILSKNKIIIFTESKETAEYLKDQISKSVNETSLLFTGGSTEKTRDIVIDNFDARAKEPKDDYRILISTEVLSEGVNLHRSNVVLNYDIPWNPTRLMQRVGRVNRIDTKFDKIYTYNFFPSEQSDNEIEITKIARAKIEAFLNLLGGDSAILTEGEPIASHELFDKLISVSTLTGEDQAEESELKYLRIIENIRENDPNLFDKIKKLPKKARSSRSAKIVNSTSKTESILQEVPSLLTFFRKGKLTKFYFTNKNKIEEFDFLTCAKILECDPNEPKGKINLDNYYEMLSKNKEQFYQSFYDEELITVTRGGRGAYKELITYLKFLKKNNQQLTDEQDKMIDDLMRILIEGSVPKQVINSVLKEIKKLGAEQANPIKLFNTIKQNIPSEFLINSKSFAPNLAEDKKEIILSLYLSED